MKPRLPASVSALMAGECIGICKAISGLLPESQTFNGFGRSCTSFQFQRFKSSKGLLFDVHNDDNDFSDLGPPVERAFGQLKLVTEKRDPFLKLDNGRKVAPRNSHRKSMQQVMGKISTLDEPHQSEFGSDDASGSAYTTSDTASMDGRRSISVRNVPSKVGLSQLVEAVSVFGELCAASVRHLPGLLSCWDLQFEPSRISMVVTIRIEGISKDASFCKINLICKQVGMIEGLAWVSKDSIDALFAVENDTELELILKKLNGTIVGGRSLSASLLHRSSSSPSISENEDARCKTALQISNYLTELKMQPRGKKVDWKELHVHMADLQMLHEGIMHLEDLPSIVDTSDN